MTDYERLLRRLMELNARQNRGLEEDSMTTLFDEMTTVPEDLMDAYVEWLISLHPDADKYHVNVVVLNDADA